MTVETFSAQLSFFCVVLRGENLGHQLDGILGTNEKKDRLIFLIRFGESVFQFFL